MMKPNIHPEYRTVVFHDTSVDEYFKIGKIMEYSERNVRQLASNEQEEYIPRKINVGVINTPTLIRSDY